MLKWFIALTISSSLGVFRDFVYKVSNPHEFTRHKLYLSRTDFVIISLFFNTIFSSILSLRIIRGIDTYRIGLLARAIVQITIMIFVESFLLNSI